METPETAPVENTGPAEGTSEVVTPEVVPTPAKPRRARTPASPSEPEQLPEGRETNRYGFIIETF